MLHAVNLPFHLFSTSYASAMVIEAGAKLNCSIESFQTNYTADCNFGHLYLAGNQPFMDTYVVVVLIVSAFDAVWRTTIPALAGDQVRPSFHMSSEP